MMKRAVSLLFISLALSAPALGQPADETEKLKPVLDKLTEVPHVASNACREQVVTSASMGVGEQLQSGLMALPNNLPKFDREKFAASAMALTRADLLACRNRDARPQQPRNVDINEFAQTLTGVWINQNRRSVHGLPIETDAVFVIDVTKNEGTGVLIDVNNLGNDRFSRRISELRLAKVKEPQRMTFVNCRYEFWDEYVKVSDIPDPRVLEPATVNVRSGERMSINRETSLTDAWAQIRKSGFFEGFDMYEQRDKQLFLNRDMESEGSRSFIAPELGDGRRKAITPSGREVQEPEIAAGLAPGAEYFLPMQTGALFEISLREVDQKVDERPFMGVSMMWNATYTGTGLGFEPNTDVLGFEQGEFLNEGGTFVAPAHLAPWRTSDCGDKNGLATPSLTFDRVVIGP